MREQEWNGRRAEAFGAGRLLAPNATSDEIRAALEELLPTGGMINEIYRSELRRALMVIPRGVFHAHLNVGTRDALLVSMPTRGYDHAEPDVFRLPLAPTRPRTRSASRWAGDRGYSRPRTFRNWVTSQAWGTGLGRSSSSANSGHASF